MEPEIVCDELTEKDWPPEYCTYPDEGCELSGSCLQCPFTGCVYDKPLGKRQMLKTLRDRQISELFHAGKDTGELAKRFGVSRRTVQRVVKKSKHEYRISKQIQKNKFFANSCSE